MPPEDNPMDDQEITKEELQECLIGALENRLKELEAVIATADLALTIAVSWAGFTFDHWDSDRDMKVGKCLSAMNGRLKGYAPDMDAFHAYRQQVHEARETFERKR